MGKMKQSATLIEYAAFYGSIKIFNYLQKNDVEITPQLWLYAIHSNNAEMIFLLEELNIKCSDNDYASFLEESIKCHHNEIASHIYDNFIDKKRETYFNSIMRYGFKYDNYFFINEIENIYMFYYSCEFDYINFIITKGIKISLNAEISLIDNKGNGIKVINTNLLKLAAKNDSQKVLNFFLSQEGIEIDKECFEGCSGLTEITLPSTIDRISERCFLDCIKLKKIIIPSTVTKIEYKAFDNCSSLEELIIPTSVKSIYNYVISNCCSLKRLTIPVSLLTRKIDDHIKLLNNENCVYENYGNPNILKMTNTITDEKFIIKKIPTCYYSDNENEFLNRISLFNSGLPTLIPVDNYLLPLFINGEDKFTLSEIKVINEAGDTIYQGFDGYIVVSKFIENHGTLEEIKKEYIESRGFVNNKMNPTIKHKALFGIASTMKLFFIFKSAFLNLTLDNVIIDSNFEPRIGFHAAQKFDQYIYNCNDNYFYIAPEVVIDDDEYNFLIADIYSFAFIMYLLFTNSVTFHDEKESTWREELKKISRGLRPKIPKNISDEYRILIQSCWSTHQDDRPSWDMIIDGLIGYDFCCNVEFGMEIDFKQFDEYSEKLNDFIRNFEESDGVDIKKVFSNEQSSDDLGMNPAISNF